MTAMSLGYQILDPEVRLELVVANNVGGSTHIQSMCDSIKQLKSRKSTNSKLLSFVGGLPKDKSAAVPERHLGLVMPTENKMSDNKDRFKRLATLIENNLDINAIHRFAKQNLLQ